MLVLSENWHNNKTSNGLRWQVSSIVSTLAGQDEILAEEMKIWWRRIQHYVIFTPSNHENNCEIRDEVYFQVDYILLHNAVLSNNSFQ
jgi:hypothetical protein